MLSVDEALRLVLERAQPLAPQRVELTGALGLVLAEPIASDIDSPPHDKSIVDGYALVAAELSRSGVELAILEEVTAGAVPTKTVIPGTATRIMTGAPLPGGADAVVMVEKTETTGERVRILQSPVAAGQNIMRRASSMRQGQPVLPAGRTIRGIELGLLAEVGRSQVPVVPQPTVAILATGNELVPHAQQPAAGQIRNSNGPLLAGLVEQAAAMPKTLEIARDDEVSLSRIAGLGLQANVLVLSGGVSAGVLDLVPQVLARLGVTEVFHKVDLKPGKPLWFGTKGQTLVFGLPGNPVSSLVCFELFVRPAIEKLSGREPTGLRRGAALLTHDHKQRGDRPTYWPAILKESVHGQEVTPLPWQGSGDLRTLTDANCLAFFPAGERVFAAGEEISVLQLPG